MSDTNIILIATMFLDYLESEESLLPIPHVMRRIHDLLVNRLALGKTRKTVADVNCELSAVIPEDSCTSTREQRHAHEVPTKPEPCPDEESPRKVENGGVTLSQSSTDAEKIIERFRDSVSVLEKADEPLYVDIQFLVTEDKEEVIKEFCAECPGFPAAWITVRAPADATPNETQNDFVKRRINGLEWRTGVIELDELRSMTKSLFGDGRQLYTKGLAKVRAITKHFSVSHRNIHDLSDLPCLSDLRRNVRLDDKDECPYHKHTWRSHLACAKKHTRAMIIFQREQ